jgi:hypothetical protein
MLDFLWGVLVAVIRVFAFVLDLLVSYSFMKKFVRVLSGLPLEPAPEVKVPRDAPTTAAEQALTEAAQRHRDDPAFFDKYGSTGDKRTT